MADSKPLKKVSKFQITAGSDYIRPASTGLYNAVEKVTWGPDARIYSSLKVRNYDASASIFSIMANQEPETPELKPTGMRWNARDLSAGAIVKTFFPSGQSREENKADANIWRERNLTRLHRQGAETAEALIRREVPQGYYVMTDSQLAKEMGMPYGDTHTNIAYQISTSKLTKEDGSEFFRTLIRPLGIPGAGLANINGVTGDRDALEKFMGAFEEIKEPSKAQLRIQRNIAVNTAIKRMLVGHKRMRVGEASNRELLDPDAFKALLNFKGKQGYVRPPQMGAGSGIRKLLAGQVDAGYNRIVGSFVNQQNLERNKAIYNTFDASFESIWAAHVAKVERYQARKTGDEAVDYALRSANWTSLETKGRMRREAWQRMMQPAIDAMQTTIRGVASNGAGSDVFTRDALTGGGSQLFQDHIANNLEELGGIEGHIKAVLRSRWDEKTTYLELEKAANPNKRYDPVNDPLKAKTKVGLFSEDVSETAYARSRLMDIDKAERERGTFGFGQQGSIRNRVVAFDNLVNKVNNELGGQVEVGKLKIHYQFQEADPRKAMHGFGVWVHIIPTSTGKAVAGELKAAQFFVPVEDINGMFHTANGSRYTGRAVGISRTVMAQLGDKGLYYSDIFKNLENVKYGLRYLSTVGLGTKSSALFREAAERRISGNLDIFSATEYMFGSITGKKEIWDLIRQGKYSKATQRANQQITGALGEEGKVGISMSGSPTQSHLAVSRQLMIADEHINDLSNFALMTRNNLYFEKWRHHFYDHNGRRNEIQEALWNAAGGDWKFEKLGGNHDAMAKHIFNTTIGTDVGYKNRMTAENRLRLASIVPNLAAVGSKATNLDSPLSLDVFNNAMVLGTSFARPKQEFDGVELRPSNDPYQNVALQRVESDIGRQFSDQKFQRNLGVGFILGAQELDEDGKVIPGSSMTVDDAMRTMGAYEQQIVVSHRAEEAFGAGANLQDMKVMAGLSKGTVVMADGKTDWLDQDIHMWSGVPALKTVKKHESINMFLIGQINMMMKKAGEDTQLVMDKLNEVMGDAHNFHLENGFIVNRAKAAGINEQGIYEANHLLQDPKDAAEKLRTLSAFAQEIDQRRLNAGRTDLMGLVRSTVFTSRSGKKYLANYIAGIQAVRVLADKNPGFAQKTHQALYSFSRRLNQNQRSMNMQAFDILRFAGEGLQGQGQLIKASLLGSSSTVKDIYRYNQMQQAYLGSVEGRHIETESLTPEEWKLRSERSSSQLTYDEYADRYGKGMKAIDLPQEIQEHLGIERLYAPGEIADVTDVGKGGFRPSKTQKSFDNVIREISDADRVAKDSIDGVADYSRAMKAIRSYQNTLGEALAGKEGFINNVFKSIGFSGRGIIKSSLQSTLYGPTEDKYGAFTAQVSPEFTKRIGVKQWFDDEEGRKFFYASPIRSPDVTHGRLAVRVYVDETLKGYGIYVHDTVRKALKGDFDGDKVRVMLAGMLDNTKITSKAYENLFREYHNAWKARVTEYKISQQNALSERAPFISTGGAFVDSIKDSLEFSSDKAIAITQRAQIAQGVIGAVMDPLQDTLTHAITNAESPQTADKLTHLRDAVGQLTEKFLAVKSKNEFDPYLLQMFVKGQAPGVIGDVAGTKFNIGGQKGILGFDKDGSLSYSPLRPGGTEGDKFTERMGENVDFIDPMGGKFNEAGEMVPGSKIKLRDYAREVFLKNEKEGSEIHTSLDAFFGFVEGLHKKFADLDAKNQVGDIKTGYNLFTAPDGSNAIRSVVSDSGNTRDKITEALDSISEVMFNDPERIGNRTSTEDVVNLFGQIGSEAQGPDTSKQTMREMEANERAALPRSISKIKNLPSDIFLSPEEQEKNRLARNPPPALPPPMATIPEQINALPPDPMPIPETTGTSMVAASIEEAKDTTERMISSPAVTEASNLVVDGAKIAGEARAPRVAKALKNPWVMAGLGAGTILGLGALTFRGGQNHDTSPDMPMQRVATGGKTRVMSNDMGGSANNYNIQIQSRGKVPPREAFNSAMYNSGNQVNVNVQNDSRSDMDTQKQNAINQLKGR